ncbi:hypothetical protein Smic_71360 [Streptomyces microflavus]|uniref:Uncharacterized protein n=1 Tax=Streptomyces microflavus TaxID=1919 RepID=A0A7J0D1G2_STRMI|nr:hypothetical protein Smic_71360 [Streptomyces microflavus]
MAAAPVQAGGPAYALLCEPRSLQGGEGGRVLGVGEGFDPLQGQFTEGQVGQGGEGVGGVALAPVLGGEQEVGLGGAVDEVLVGEGYVADGGVVREQDDEVVAGAVLDVGDEPFAEIVERARPDPDLLGGDRVGAPVLEQLGVVRLQGGEGHVLAAPESFPRGVRRFGFVLVHARIVRGLPPWWERGFGPDARTRSQSTKTAIA